MLYFASGNFLSKKINHRIKTKRVFPESFQLLTKANEMKYIRRGFKNHVFAMKYFITIE